MTSLEMRANPLFMRNGFKTAGRWDIPFIKKQDIPLNNIELISYSDTRLNASSEDKAKGVHFYIDDYRFTSVYNDPKRTLDKLSQYAFLCTPDFSTYQEMDYWRQLESVAHSRWVGAYWQSAYWQSKGLTVIPTVTWSDIGSYTFCFDGIETGSIVSIGTLGCKSSKNAFLCGYSVMMERIKPMTVICFDKPFPEMEGNVVYVDYRSSRKVVR